MKQLPTRRIENLTSFLIPCKNRIKYHPRPCCDMFLRLSRISRPQLIILFEPIFDLKSRECRLYISKRFTFVAGVYSIFFAAVLAFSQDGRKDGHDWAEKSVRHTSTTTVRLFSSVKMPSNVIWFVVIARVKGLQYSFCGSGILAANSASHALWTSRA
jgi:hypothetical protein